MIKKQKKITIREVAEKAGVSTATVSRILNGESGFPQVTRKKIWSAAHSLGYEPSMQARQLRSGQEAERLRTNLIMYIFNLTDENPIGDRFTADCAQMFSWLASQQGFYTTNYRYFRREGFHCPLILDRLIDGAVIGSPHQEVIECVSRKVPTVLINVGASPLFPEIPRVSAATENGMHALLLKAHQMGHRKTAFVGSIRTVKRDCFCLDYPSMIFRLVEEMGFELTDAHRYQPPDLKPSNHERCMDEVTAALLTEIRARKNSLILCEDSVYAKSIYTRLIASGIRIPEDVSMITVDSISPVLKQDCVITSASHDWPRLYTAALDVLKVLINGKEPICREFIVPVLLQEGRTLSAPRTRKRSQE